MTHLTHRGGLLWIALALTMIPTAAHIAAGRHGAAAVVHAPSPDLLSAGLPVTTARPRILLTPARVAQLRAKETGGDPAWLALKARADTLSAYRIFPYNYANRSDEPDNTIFYDYQGEGWYNATLTLGLAYRITGDAKYLRPLLALADEMIRAQYAPANNPPKGLPPLRPDDYYPTRYLGPVVAIIYDWCDDRLGAARKAALIRLMNAYFDDLRANAYQANDHADGNYMVSHMLAAAAMGYASFGDNPRAPEMIAYARIRFDGTPSPLVARANVPSSHLDQVFDGGYKPAIATDYNGPAISGAPFKGGFDFQGWAYGTGTFGRLIDYLTIVRSATGEDLIGPHRSWFGQILRMEKEMLWPDRFKIDPAGDWGSDYGAVIHGSLPLRLAYALEGTADGPGAQHFATAELATASPEPCFPDYAYQEVSQPAAWESVLYVDARRPSTELRLPPYYSAFGPAYPRANAGATNGAIPYFLMRSDWGPDATWAAAHMGAAWYDDHQHLDAGHLLIARGRDALLVDASNWKGTAGSCGIVGSSFDETAGNSGAANTLWFDDRGEFQRTDLEYIGGQGLWGEDQVVADEQNDAGTYVRSDLSTAYNRGGDPADQRARKLIHFYRSFLYLRAANLFVVYDQTQAAPSRNRYGPYALRLRWHVPNRPTVTGATVQVDQGASRLYLTTLLPRGAQPRLVDESHNPDPCDGAAPSCKPQSDSISSGTWRVEVGDPANALVVPFLTVLQPGSRAAALVRSATLSSPDGTMIGTRLVGPSGVTIVLFNNRPGQVPAPITQTSYADAGPRGATHVLCGLAPNAHYAVSYAGGIIHVAQDAAGVVVASPAGVLRFME